MPAVLQIIYDLEPAGPECRLLTLGRRLPPGSMLVCVTSDRLTLLPDFVAAQVPVLVAPVKKAYLAGRRLGQIYGFARKNKVTVVSVYDLKALLLALGLKLLSRGRMRLVYNHVTALEDFCTRQRLLLAFFLRWVDRALCNSRFSMAEIAHFVAAGRIGVIHNGVDTGVFRRREEERQTARRAFGCAAGDLLLGTVAGFRPVKDYPFLLTAFARLAGRYPNTRLLCVGDGPERAAMEILAAALGVRHRVVFAGKRQDVAHCLQAMDIFLMTSRWEGLPNAILEAMSCGLPVLASEVGGCAEVVDNGRTGLLYKAGDARMFDAGLARLLEDPRAAADMGIAARRRVLEKFSLDAMVAAYATFFSSMAG